jgi:intein-encoded DNA endonuclease-like protein
MTYSVKFKRKIIELKESGSSYRQISNEYGISTSTLQSWITNKDEIIDEYDFDHKMFLQLNSKSYSYVLGMYLGDGYINKYKTHKSPRLRITCDIKYQNIIDYLVDKLKDLFPNNSIQTVIRKDNCIDVGVYSDKLFLYFPQYGVGKKHKRNIKLEPWQTECIDYVELIKGLIHSDGCCYSEKINNNLYYRYSFANYSDDILDIFKECCDHIGLEYDHHNMIRIEKKSSVEKLKTLIGDKTMIV